VLIEAKDDGSGGDN